MNDTNSLQQSPSLEGAQKAYTYNYTYIEPIAMADTLPDGEGFASDWVVLTARNALRLVINTLIANYGDRGKPGVKDDVKRVLRTAFRKTLADLGRRGRLKLYGAVLTIVPQLLFRGFPTSEEEVESFINSPAIQALGDDFLSPFADNVLKTVDLQTDAGHASSLEQFRKLFAYVDLPEIANTFQADEMFAYLRVAGANPLVIARMTAPDPRLPVTEADYKQAMGDEADSLEQAIAEGRVYLADYSILAGALEGSFGPEPEEQKYIYPPLAMFAVPAGDGPHRLLKPVAIQTGSQAAEDYITAATGKYAWLAAKTTVQIADANYHEAISHLARTHLLVEPFVMATHRQLPATHPLFKLLVPHFQGTLAINNAAQAFLVAPQGGVNALLSCTIEQSRTLAVKGLQMRGFNAEMLYKRLQDRGVDDRQALPVYPYRDDALLVWDAIHEWAGAYLALYYTDSDTADGGLKKVTEDAHLQNWAKEIVAFEGGRLTDFGSDGRGAIDTLEYLVDAVTLIIFTGSAQHAAVNFPQKGIMSYAPAMPTAGYLPGRKIDKDMTEADYFQLLPPLDQAQSGLNLLYLLGSVYYSKLGDYKPDHFDDPQVEAPLKVFQDQLKGIGEEIDRRNLNRPDYDYLKPTNIPQSINI
ncbi:lipoxygenase family protein [Synechococcus sp. PCC 7336]|uniref:lipoxygenase family protein n=1 Tax=Synechococcus sp. PCC 7336 TaxID=195250 RepID=UPI000345563A|nr:lipoxygenase family protein [Synechococcus sp. PCC 7336]